MRRDTIRRFPRALLEKLSQRLRRAEKISSRTKSYFRRLEQIAQFHTVVDVGAHIGEFATSCAVCLPGVPIHCFEPLPACQESLQTLSARYEMITVHPFALGEVEGSIKINQNDYRPSSSILAMMDRHRELWPKTMHGHVIEGQIRRLDSFNALFEEPLLLKLDVQGYEKHVLRGAEAVLNKAAVIQLEILFAPLYDGQPDFRDIMNHLGERGFRFLEFSDERRMGPNRDLVYADAVFVADVK